MLVNPYGTSIGTMINVKQVTESLTKYLISADKNLNYEYDNAEECRVVFIVGKNDDEKALPIWEHPLVFEDHRGKKIVATDMRKYIKLSGEVINMSSLVSDHGGYEFMVLRTLIISDMASGIYGQFKAMDKYIVGGYSKWITESISASTMLSLIEKVELEIITSHFLNMLLVNGEVDSTTVETSKVKISKSKLSVPVNLTSVAKIVDKLKHDVTNIDDLTANIKAGLNSPKISMIDSNTIINMISNSWYGPGGSETIIMGIENVPTWIAMMYAGSNNNSYKRSRLATILDKNKNKIGLKEFSKNMELYLKDKTLL